MKKRVITGIGYVVVMVSLLAMKIYVPSFEAKNGNILDLGSIGIDLLFWAISVIGAY